MEQATDLSAGAPGGDSESTDSVFSWPQALLVYAAFMIATLLCQWWGMDAKTVYDGAYFVSSKKVVFESHDIMRVISMIPARPLFLFSFYLNYLASGMDAFYLRLGNAAFVAAAGLSLTLLIGLILSIPGLGVNGSRRGRQTVSLLAGLIFVVHPLQSFVVLYVWQREAAMACFFVFSGLAVYLATRLGRFSSPIVGYVLTALIFLAGMLSKENVVVLPPLMVAAEFILLRLNFRRLIDRTAIIAVTLLPSAVLYLIVTKALHAPHSELEQGIWNRLAIYYAAGGLSIPEVVMTECRVFFGYLSMAVFPFLRDPEFMRAMTVSRSLLNPPETLAAVAGALVMGALAIWLIRRRPAPAFGLFFVFISLAPESLLIPQYLFFGYRAILPTGGLLLILAWAALPAFDWLAARRISFPAAPCAAAAAVILAVCALGWTAAERAGRWTHVSFWTDLSDRLPPYAPDVERTPFLDITANCLSVLVGEGLNEDAIKLFQRVALDKALPQPAEAPGPDTKDAMERFVKEFQVAGARAGGALISLGAALQNSGRNDEAMVAYLKSIDMDPSHSDVRVSVGVLLEQAGKLDEAIENYRKAVEVNPESALAYNCLGNALKKSGKIFEAMPEYAKAIAVDPKASMGHMNLAMALHETGYLQEATEEYRKALELEETSADIHHKLGRALAEQSEFAEAIAQYARALALQPGLTLARADMALALEFTGDLAGAIDQYRRAAAADPNSAMIQMCLGRALIAAGRGPEAVAALNRALALDPNQPTALYLLGTSQDRLGRLGQAMVSLKRAVELAPQMAEAQRSLGVALCRSGDCAEGLRRLKIAEGIEPADPQTALLLGWALDTSGSPEIAETYYRRAIELKPDFVEAHYGLARNLQASGKMEEAVEAFRATVALAPDTVEPHADMAVALLHLGRVPEAIVSLGKALSLDKENVQLLYALGEAYARMRDRAEAVKYLRKALDMSPDHPAATALLRELNQSDGE